MPLLEMSVEPQQLQGIGRTLLPNCILKPHLAIGKQYCYLFTVVFLSLTKRLQTFGGPSGDYTIIAIGDDYSVEYDCTVSALGVTNYCVHVLSSTRTMDQSLFDDLIAQAESLGLNPQQLPVEMTVQNGC